MGATEMELEWQYEKDCGSTAHVEAGSSVYEAMKQLCVHIVNDVIPRNEGVKWDHLRVDISPDPGQFVVLPASTSTPYRIEKADCQLIFEELSQRYQELADSEIDDDEFSKLLKAEERKWFERFLQAARDTKLRGLRVIFTSGGDDEPLEDVIV